MQGCDKLGTMWCGLAFITFSVFKASEIKEFCEILKGQSVTKIKIKDNNYIIVANFLFFFPFFALSAEVYITCERLFC